MTAPVRPIAKLSERVTALEQEKVTFRRATVVAVSKLFSTFDADIAGADRLNGIPAEPQFLPQVGDTVLLELSGAVPIYQPHRISEGAIGEGELAEPVREQIATAITTADGKNTLFYSTQPATLALPGRANGDLWFQQDTFGLGQIVGTWQWDGAAWIAKVFHDNVLSSLTVGKLVAGTMVADVTISGQFATALSGQRVALNSLGLQKWNSANELLISITGTQSLITGQTQTAASGERLIMNPGGTQPSRLDFYPSTGAQFATIEAETVSGQAAVLLTANNASTTVKSGVIAVRRSFAHLGFGTRALVLDSSVYADASTVRTVSQIIDLQIVNGLSTPGGARIAMGVQGNSNTQINVWATPNSGGQPWMNAPNQDVGFFFYAGIMNIVGNAVGQRRDLNVGTVYYTGALTFASSAELKTGVADFSDVDMRAATRKARIKKFRMPIKDEPARPGDDVFGPTKARVAPEQIGFLAEEMPKVAQSVVPNVIDGQDMLGLDLNTIVALLWGGLGQVYDEIDELKAKVDK